MKNKNFLIVFFIIITSLLVQTSFARGRKYNTLDFDWLYGRIIGGLIVDPFVIVSEDYPFWQGTVSLGKDDFYSFSLMDNYSHSSVAGNIFELPTISSSINFKNNWRFSLTNLDYLNKRHSRENYKYEFDNEYWIYFRNRSKSLSFGLSTIYLSQKGKIKVPYKMRNVSYYEGLFLNRKQIEMFLEYQYMNRSREKNFFGSWLENSEIRRKYWRLGDDSHDLNSFEASLAYGISNRVNLNLTQNLKYSNSSGFVFISSEKENSDFYTYASNNIFKQRVSNTFVQLKALLSPRWQIIFDTGIDYCKEKYQGIRELETWGSATKIWDFSTNFKLLYLSPNPAISFGRLIDDYNNYYGHLLGKNQIKILTDILFKKHKDSQRSGNQPYSSRLRWNLFAFAQNFVYGLDEKINFKITYSLNKKTKRYYKYSNTYSHSLSFGYKLGLVVYSYTYEYDYREEISWVEVSDFNYYFAPLLSRGKVRFEIMVKPKTLSKSWSSSSGDLFDFKKLKVDPKGSWSISTQLQWGITDNLQLSFHRVVTRSPDEEHMSHMALLDFEFWKNGRFYVKYEHNKARGSSHSSDYNTLTLGMNLLLK